MEDVHVSAGRQQQVGVAVLVEIGARQTGAAEVKVGREVQQSSPALQNVLEPRFSNAQIASSSWETIATMSKSPSPS